MDTHRFFVGSLSDIEGENTYLDNLGDDNQTAAPFSDQANFPGFAADTSHPITTASSLPGSVQDQPIWDPSVMPQKSVEGEIVQPSTMYFNPSLEVPEPYRLSAQRPSATPVTRSSTRTRSSSNSVTLRQLKSPATSTLTTTPAMSPPEPSPRTRPQRKPRRVKTPPEDDEEMEDSVTVGGVDDPLREKHLERNRVAASKCRQKKKVFVADLEETKTDLEMTNSRLQAEFKGLQAEASRIKDELMNHASCHDDNINRWIDNEAKNFVNKTKNRFDSTHLTPSPALPHRHLSGGMSTPMRMSTPMPVEIGQYPGDVAMMDPGFRGPMFGPGPDREGIAYSQAPNPGLLTPSHPEFPGMGTMPPPHGGPGMGYGHMPGNMF